MKPEIEAKAKEYFETYPNESVLHITSDGQVFLNANKDSAQSHQRQFTLADAKQVLISVHRKGLNGEVAEGAESEEEGEQEESEQKEAEQDQATAPEKQEEAIPAATTEPAPAEEVAPAKAEEEAKPAAAEAPKAKKSK